MPNPWDDEDYRMPGRDVGSYEHKSPGTATWPGAAAGGFGLASLIPGLGALGPIGAGLAGVAMIAQLLGSRGAQKEEEERRKKQEALQRAAQMSRSFEQSGWGGY